MNDNSDKSDGTIDSSESAKPKGLPAPTEQVGFCRPPEATRFKKGVSGNPNGRPKGSLNVATAFTKALREKVVINEGGQRKIVTKLEAALKQLANKGASGDLRALAQLTALAQDAEAKQNMPGAHEPVVSEIDQEVMEGILRRFVNSTDEEQIKTTEEKNNGDSVDNERN
jgi:hypothetical protein